MTYVAVPVNQRTHNQNHYMWRQMLWECMKGRAMKTDPRYLVVTFYQTIHKVWWWKMAVCQNLSC